MAQNTKKNGSKQVKTKDLKPTKDPKGGKGSLKPLNPQPLPP